MGNFLRKKRDKALQDAMRCLPKKDVAYNAFKLVGARTWEFAVSTWLVSDVAICLNARTYFID